MRDDAQQTHYFNNAVIAPTGKYEYDPLYRLLKAEGRELSSLNAPDYSDFVNNIPVPSASDIQNYSHYYSYDALGNIQSVQSVGGNGWTRTYNYNTANNYLTSTQIGQDTSVYTYDIQGNMLTMPHLSVMEWDYSGNLKKSTLGTVNTWYCYDMQGIRVRKVTEKQGGITEERIYLNGYEVYRKHISGVLDLERQSLNILDVKQVEEGEGEEKQVKFEYDYNKKNALVETKTVENGEEITTPTPLIRYQYDNHLGSACLELDSTAAIISYEEYHPFGTTSYRSGRSETEASLKRYKYVGKERDEETGLYYYGARYYAAWLCRFVSVDALQFKYPELTPFQYASNRPITAIDLDGLEAIIITDNAKSRSQSVLKVINNSSYLMSLTFKRKDVYERAKTDMIFINTRDIGGGTLGEFTPNFANYAKIYRDNWQCGNDPVKNNKLSDVIYDLGAFGFGKDDNFDFLKYNKAKNMYVLNIDRSFFNTASLSELTQVVMHEIIAHYFNVKNKDDGGIEDHLAFFGIDPKNPYNDKFYKKNEIDAIMTLGTDVKGDASYSPLRFKPGSEAYKIMEAVESAIKIMKK